MEDNVYMSENENQQSQSYGIRPTPFQIFKKSAAARFKPVRPNEFEVGYILLQMAPGLNAQKGDAVQYDWQNRKIGVKLGFADIQGIIQSLATNVPFEAVHKFNGATKSIRFDLNEERGGYFISVLEINQDGNKNNIRVPISIAETTTLYHLMVAFLPTMLNWS